MDSLHAQVTAAQKGDLDAFSAIVARFQRVAYASAYAMLNDAHLAEDVAQEAFIEAYLNLPKLREPAAFPGWFRRIIVKQGDRVIRGKHLMTLPFEATDSFDLPLADLDPATIIEQRETQHVVRNAIETLPQRERIVTLLFYGTGYALKDIAAFLDIPATTVKKRLFDARKRLKERLMNVIQDTLHEGQPHDEQFPDRIRLLIAIRTGDIEEVKILLERDMRLVHMRLVGENALTSVWRLVPYASSTALNEAASHGQLALVKLLIEYGANVNSADRYGITPLHKATLCNHKEVVQLLLANGADPNIMLCSGLTPLHWAAMRNYADIARQLLSRRALVNVQAVEGLTPLHWAALKNHVEVAYVLLSAGADTHLKNTAGQTALDCALAKDHLAFASLLQQHLALQNA